jgi:hypothetical protein
MLRCPNLKTILTLECSVLTGENLRIDGGHGPRWLKNRVAQPTLLGSSRDGLVAVAREEQAEP